MKALVAVSGGADSTYLLLSLHERQPGLAAVHCNHRLRGAASDADEHFVRSLCARHKIPLKVFRKKITKGPGLEARARLWRMECYLKAAVKFFAKKVLLAHHANDQAETLLLNLARGAGLQGAAGIRESISFETGRGKVRIERPLLERDPNEMRAWLRARGQTWREDASNREPISRRNALRARVIPQLEKIMPGAALRLAAFARRAREAEDVLSSLGREALKKAKSGKSWRLSEFRDAPPWLRRRMLMALESAGMDESALARAEKLVEKGQGQADLRLNIYLEARRGRLFLRIR